VDRGEEVERKLERVRRWLAAEGRPALLVRQRPNFAWLTAGGRGHVSTARDAAAGALLVTPDRFALVASNIEAARLAEEELAGVPIEVADYAWHDDDGERRVLAALVPVGGAPAADTDAAVAAAVLGLRAPLLAAEVRRAGQLGALTARVVEGVCRSLERGQTEHDVAAAVHAAAVRAGARVPVCLVAADDRIARRRHPLPTEHPIDRRAMVAVCIERDGLVCSATRLVNFEPVAGDLRRRHDAVCRVDAAAARATRVGRPLRDVFADIVTAYVEAGYPDEWRHHHQGGATGYQPRDAVAGPGAAAAVRDGALYAWNPSIAGTKSEDTLLATADGVRPITAPGTEWPSVDVETAGGLVRRADILVRG
jgi:Xaa-Pro aminopeptidase